MSEEAQESRNKDFKKYTDINAREISRITRNEDLLNRLLIYSHPLLTSLRPLSKTLRPKVLQLLVSPRIRQKIQNINMRAVAISLTRTLKI
jgi:hypothetical protein